MQIFHGSEEIIKNPQFGFGNPRNDYGLGFYCTESVDLAKEGACQKNNVPFATMLEHYPIEHFLQSYRLLHEADITKAEEIIMEKINEK